MNKQPSDEDGRLYSYINGDLYCTSNELPHDIFRIGGYPNDELFSIMETMRFCNKNNIKLNKDQKTRLQKFWFENPDGMIRFG